MVLIVGNVFYRLIIRSPICYNRLQYLRYFRLSSASLTETNPKTENFDLLNKKLQNFEGVIFYCDYLEQNKLKMGYKKNQATLSILDRKEKELSAKARTIQPIPISLRYLEEFKPESLKETNLKGLKEEKEAQSHFPFSKTEEITSHKVDHTNKVLEDDSGPVDIANISDIEVKRRLELSKDKTISDWMTNYENYEKDVDEENHSWTVNYGTPDPNSRISKVPCGGCGAFLHCKDTSIPGYIPSEIFKNSSKPGAAALNAIICQRCYFLKEHNLALQVQVAPEDYPKVLLTIKERKRALVVLMVDLLDFPCSIWPGIPDLLNHGQPIIVVGNKVDLLPQDSRGYLERIKKNLIDNLKLSGFATTNIKHVALISAKTGYGIEELITNLYHLWMYKGDVFLVGCTNVGKSSLFNALLKSDYCKVQAGDLIQRATTSPWPGTTLNLLKFPITRPDGWRLHVRMNRLISASKILAQEKSLRKSLLNQTGDLKYATLIGHIDRTFTERNEENVKEVKDPFSFGVNAARTGQQKMGINDKDKTYALNKWCYDTPGVVQPDQITHLLTTEEIVLSLPKIIIRPKTYCIKPGTTLFIGGLGRLDYVEGPTSIRLTVFCSHNLPITICNLQHADSIYDTFLGTEVFLVPHGGNERLKLWPGLKDKNKVTVKGIDNEMSCNDIVLSSAGWIAVTPPRDVECTLNAWTPEARGIYVREALLPKAVSLRGRRIRHSPAYVVNKFFMQ